LTISVHVAALLPTMFSATHRFVPLSDDVTFVIRITA